MFLAAAILLLIVPFSTLGAVVALVWPDIDDPDPTPSYGAAAVFVIIALGAAVAAVAIGAVGIRGTGSGAPELIDLVSRLPVLGHLQRNQEVWRPEPVVHRHP